MTVKELKDYLDTFNDDTEIWIPDTSLYGDGVVRLEKYHLKYEDNELHIW